MTRTITFTYQGVSYQIRMHTAGAAIVAFGPESERRATILDDLDLSDITDDQEVLAGICEAALNRPATPKHPRTRKSAPKVAG